MMIRADWKTPRIITPQQVIEGFESKTPPKGFTVRKYDNPHASPRQTILQVSYPRTELNDDSPQAVLALEPKWYELRDMTRDFRRFFRVEWRRNPPNAQQVLRMFSDLYPQLGHGVEDIWFEKLKFGISYINMGDTYDQTLIAYESKIVVGNWGDIAEREL